MANPITTYMGPHVEALPLRDQRLKLIASNLANADTPGYKAKDLNFEAALDAATGKAPLRTTDQQHFEFPAPPGQPPFQHLCGRRRACPPTPNAPPMAAPRWNIAPR